MPTGPKIKVVGFKAPRTSVCPTCKVEQPFKKGGERWKKVMPTPAHRYELVAGDAVKGRLLYREEVKEFLVKLKEFGLNPWAIVFDLWTAFPKQARDVWPGIIIQFDYFHPQQWIHRHFKNAVLRFRKRDTLAKETWWHESWHLCQVINFLKSGRLDYALSYPEYPAIPPTGN